MSIYIQSSFLGGMNLLNNDTGLADNQYRIGFNVRNRFDSLDACLSSVQDTTLPEGLIQEMVTFGNYLIAFISGKCWYRLFNATKWNNIPAFSMSQTAPRYWTKSIPVSTTNYARQSTAVDDTNPNVPNAFAPISQLNTIAAALGNFPGLLVQDGINQPQFIYIDNNLQIQCRTTQTYDQWSITFDSDGVTVLIDNREYVPIGTYMEWWDGTLCIVSLDTINIFRSVTGRPLDFVVNVKPDGTKGGDATTTGYSIGVGGISTIRAMSDGSLFVAAANAVCYSVLKNTTPGAPMLFGEYTFIRKFLFFAGCLSDRAIVDALGDTYFMDLTGARSFNAVVQLQNEGRNSIFTKIIQSAYDGIIQDASKCAVGLFDNYVFFGARTIFGNNIAVYDTINQCWSSFDTLQTNSKAVKLFLKLEIDVQRFYAVTEDNKLYQLYIGPSKDICSVRTLSITVVDNDGNRERNPKLELKPIQARCIVDNVTQSGDMTVLPVVNNRQTKQPAIIQPIEFSDAVRPIIDNTQLPDVNTGLSNLIFPFLNCGQGWKCYLQITWTGDGKLTQFSLESQDITPAGKTLTAQSGNILENKHSDDIICKPVINSTNTILDAEFAITYL